MRKHILMLLFFTVIAAGCSNQMRELNGYVVKTAGTVEISDAQNDYIIDAAIPIPTQVQATQGDFSDRIRISWQQVFYGESQIQYHVYRETVTKSGESSLIRLTGYRPISQLHFDDLVSGSVVPGVEYKYYVRAINMSSPNTEGSVLSIPVVGYALAGVTVVTADFRISTEKVNVRWGAVQGASFYYLYRAEEPYENVIPNIDNFVRLDQAFTECSYDDYSVTSGGSLESGKSYYYYVEACFDRETVSQRSGFTRGALLSAGAPAEGEILSVSQAEVLNAIRITWKKEDSVNEYRIYRITKDDLDSGNYVGTEVVIALSDIKTDGSAAVWYDRSEDVRSGDSFYYRVAAVNDYGAGSLSSPDIEDPVEQSRIAGKAIPSAELMTPYAMLTRTGFYVSWPSCFTTINGDEGYYLFVADGSSGETPADESGWNLLTDEAVKGTEITLSGSDLTSVLNGTAIADAKLWFRVLPVNTRVISGYTPGSGVTVSPDYTKYENELGEADVQTYLVGRSSFMTPLYFEKKAPVLLSVKASEGTETGTVKVTAELDLNSEMGYLYDIKLERVCYYGDEKDVYPLSLPPANTNPSDSKCFTKQGQAKVSHTKYYPMGDYFDSGIIEWNDPMPDYDVNGEKGTVTWDYATWDREAWKCILRKKDVDMRQFMKIEYRLISVDLSNNQETILNQTPAVGWPDLTDKEFAHLAKWMTDCALNTIWQLNIPRMLWDNTVSWLPSLSFSHNGEKGGKMVFNVGSVTNLSGSGGTDGSSYSDWSGYSIKLSMSMKVSLESNQPRQVTLNGVQITTPLYSGTMDMQITVRDFGPFWGLWAESDGSYAKGGYIKVKSGKKSAVTFNPSEIIMKGTGDTDVFDYQVHGYDLDRDLDPGEKGTYPEKGGGSWHFTRINWPGRPYPENNDYMKNQGKQAAINYGTTAW